MRNFRLSITTSGWVKSMTTSVLPSVSRLSASPASTSADKRQILGGLHRRHHGRTDFALGSQYTYSHALHPRPDMSRRILQQSGLIVQRKNSQESREDPANGVRHLIRPVPTHTDQGVGMNLRSTHEAKPTSKRGSWGLLRLCWCGPAWAWPPCWAHLPPMPTPSARDCRPAPGGALATLFRQADPFPGTAVSATTTTGTVWRT